MEIVYFEASEGPRFALRVVHSPDEAGAQGRDKIAQDVSPYAFDPAGRTPAG